MMSKVPAWLKLLFKLAFTALCLWYIINKIDWSQSVSTFQRSNIIWLLPALVLFVASKVVSSFRLNIYLSNIGVHLPEKNNLQLYWLGMFYNLFLPGGIGGDAYKVILLRKKVSTPTKLLSAAVFLDRISGVVGLMILAAIYYFFVFDGANYSTLLVIAILPSLALYYFIIKKFFPSFIPGFWSTLWLGLLVQLLQVACIYFILLSLHIYNDHSAYMLIFLVSSVVAILPFTIGGLGAREVVFLWGSKQFNFDVAQSVCISLLFYLITVLVSLVGIYFTFKQPALNAYISDRELNQNEH